MDNFIKNLPKLPNFIGMGYCNNPLSRHLIKRGEIEIKAAYNDTKAKTYLLSEGKVLLKQTANGRDPLFTMAEASQFQMAPYQEVLLGYLGDEPRFAMEVLQDLDNCSDNIINESLRALAMKHMVEPEHVGALALANSLLSWHKSHKFCAKCGNQSQIMDGGYRRMCTSCGAEHFPRTDPVVIMLIIKDDHCLLGSGHNFDPTMYSALAGFMEPGETIEDAVRRETLEEAGIAVGDVHYLTSQPWPMPHTLMIGCIGVATNYDINIDEEELRDCKWFSRNEIKRMHEDQHHDELKVPPSFAIASQLIQYWLINE
jgi:NAD+ diphosphatase